MITLSFEKKINAPMHRVWDVLWSQETYNKWTKHFSEGSGIRSDWKLNGKTYFTDASGKNGMITTIIKMDQPRELVFQHIGILKDGEEDLSSEEVNSFAGALESYRMAEEDGVTTLTGSCEISPEYEEHMKNGFEKGFEEVKKMAEA